MPPALQTISRNQYAPIFVETKHYRARSGKQPPASLGSRTTQPHRQRPDRWFPLGGISPRPLKIRLDELHRISLIRGDETLRRRPGAQITNQMRERPEHFDLKFRSFDFVKRKRHLAIAAPDQPPLRRPEGADNLIVITPHERLNVRRKAEIIVSPDSNYAGGRWE